MLCNAIKYDGKKCRYPIKGKRKRCGIHSFSFVQPANGTRKPSVGKKLSRKIRKRRRCTSRYRTGKPCRYSAKKGGRKCGIHQGKKKRGTQASMIRIEELGNEITELKAEKEELLLRLEAKTAALKASGEGKEANSALVANLRAENQSLKTEIESLKAEVGRLRREIDNLTAKLAKELAAQKSILEKRISDKEFAFDNLQKEYDKTGAQIIDLKNQLSGLEALKKEKNELAREKASLEKQIGVFSSNEQALKNKLSSLEKVEEEKAALLEELKLLKEKAKVVEKEAQVVSKEHKVEQEQLATVEKIDPDNPDYIYTNDFRVKAKKYAELHGNLLTHKQLIQQAKKKANLRRDIAAIQRMRKRCRKRRRHYRRRRRR